jgi:hypothetical protein
MPCLSRFELGVPIVSPPLLIDVNDARLEPEGIAGDEGREQYENDKHH